MKYYFVETNSINLFVRNTISFIRNNFFHHCPLWATVILYKTRKPTPGKRDSRVWWRRFYHLTVVWRPLTAVQGHPRSSILVLMESPYLTSWIVTLAVSAIVFEIFTVKDRKLLILPLPCLTHPLAQMFTETAQLVI